MRQRVVALLAAIALSGALMGAAGAAPGSGDVLEVQGAFTDLDGDGLDDALDELIADARPNDRVRSIVTMTPGGTEAAIRRAAGAFTTARRFDIVRGFEAEMTVGQIRGLSHSPSILRIEPVSRVSATIEGSTTEFGTDAARTTYGVDGSGVTICISDSGVDTGHEQLDNGKVVGFIDYVGTGTSSYDDFGHGTHVANIAAGDGVGGPGAAAHAGVAPGASILAAKTLDAVGNGDTADVVASIQWCVDEGADIISLSLGAPEGADGSDAMSQAVENAVQVHGVPVVVAAGNSGDGLGTVNAPGAAPSAITVGAVAESVGTPGDPARSFGIHLAGFSSRGPNAAGVMKPDVVAPGVTISAAQTNTSSGYVIQSGTSMATPFVAGTLALALERDATLSATALKDLVTSTAQDRGLAGDDNNWGAGLLDGWAVVSAAGGDTYTPTAFPRQETGTGSVATGGLWTHEFTLGSDDMTTPIGITLLIDGQAVCTLFCLSLEWDPDLDARLVDPTGAELDESLCPSEPHCGTLLITQGQQETFGVMPTVPGAYRLEVWPVSTGGTFSFDISAGAGNVTPPSNLPPTAEAGPAQNVPDTKKKGTERVTLDGSGSFDTDGTIESWTWSIAGTPIATGEVTNATLAVGTHLVTLEVVDDDGAAATDTVTIAVGVTDDPPTADAGPDQPAVPDADLSGSELVTLDGSGSTDDNGIVAYSWQENGTEIATGVSAVVDLAIGSHTITLEVTDTVGNTDTDQVVITVESPLGTFPMHVHDLDVTATASGKNKWTATVDVFVVGTDLENDPNFPLVAGVDPSTVTFQLSSGGTISCTTVAGIGLDGRCSATTSALGKGVKNLTLTVVSVSTPGFTYEPADNHDGDGDSDGTSISIARP